MPSKTKLTERAFEAWLRHRPEPRPPTPTLSASTVEEYDGKTYVFLRRGDSIVDVYRYIPATENTRDTLKRLERYYPGPYGRQKAVAA